MPNVDALQQFGPLRLNFQVLESKKQRKHSEEHRWATTTLTFGMADVISSIKDCLYHPTTRNTLGVSDRPYGSVCSSVMRCAKPGGSDIGTCECV